jgi:hypothetical protein
MQNVILFYFPKIQLLQCSKEYKKTVKIRIHYHRNLKYTCLCFIIAYLNTNYWVLEMEWKYWNEKQIWKEVKLVLSSAFTTVPWTLQKHRQDSRVTTADLLPYYTLNNSHANLLEISQLPKSTWSSVNQSSTQSEPCQLFLGDHE